MHHRKIKVLFIASGNKDGNPGAVVQNQADTLINAGLEVDFYLIRGKGFKGYINNIYPLFKYLKKTDADIIHSHYSLSALVTSFALLLFPKKPHVVSLMGSDGHIKGVIKFIVKIFYKYFWKKTIVKSQQMILDTELHNALVIPNGVDLKKIMQIETEIKVEPTNISKKHILFAADPAREVKNYKLAVNSVNNTSASLKVVYNQPHKKVIAEIFDAKVLILTSLWEGSPNIIKEAMACNCPIVSTKVGDVEWLLGKDNGHFLTSNDPIDIADKLELALNFAEKQVYTNGRNRIIELELDAESVVKRLLNVYEEAIKR